VHTIVKGALARAHQKNITHEVTNLPTGELINEQYRALISSDGWALAKVHINGFWLFTQAYGTVIGEDVLRFTALLLNEVINELGTPEDFVGHMVIGPDFVITSTPEHLPAICTKICERFDAEIGLHYNYKDRRNGYIVFNDEQGHPRQLPLMSLSIGFLTSSHGPFYDIRGLSEAIEELRQQAVSEAREQGRKSHIRYSDSDQDLAAEYAAILQIKALLESNKMGQDLSFLAVHIEAEPKIADGLRVENTVQLPHASQIIQFGDVDVVATVPNRLVEQCLDAMFDHFELLVQEHQQTAQLIFGCVQGPYQSITELAAALANDMLDRRNMLGFHTVYNPFILRIEPGWSKLQHEYEYLQEIYAHYHSQLNKKLNDKEPRIQAEVRQLTAVVDHDLGSGLSALRDVLNQLTELDPTPSVQTETSIIALKRQLTLCSVWKRCIAELGAQAVLQQQSLDLKDWLYSQLQLICDQLQISLNIDVSRVSTRLPVQLNTQAMSIACLHLMLIMQIVNAHTLRITSSSFGPSGHFKLIIEDDGERTDRMEVINVNSSSLVQDHLLPLHHNISLLRSTLWRQNIHINFDQRDNVFLMTCTIPVRSFDHNTKVLTSVELTRRKVQIEQEIEKVKQKLFIEKSTSVNIHQEILKQILLPYVHPFEQSLQLLIDEADFLQQSTTIDISLLRRIRSISLYCYLLIRNLALVLEGVTLPVEHIHVNEQILQTIDLLNHKISDINIDLDFAPDLPQVKIASVEIQQILMNLIKNAIEAMHYSGRLFIRTRHEKNFAIIEVQDTGSGILRTYARKIFQLNFSTKGKGTDSGVGLYAVQSIVQRAGGTIRVASAARAANGRIIFWRRGFKRQDNFRFEPTGTIFQIELPIAKE
jgi:signal transduction histidine kinase